jgi:hypothetical protein
MQFNVQGFNNLLESYAEPMLWRRSNACPCLNPNSGSPDINCSLCGGKGRLWDVPRELDKGAAVASSSTQQAWAKMGIWQQGDLVLSIPESSPMYEISQFDRVTQLTSTDDFSLVLIHGSQKERIFGQVKSISRVFWKNSAALLVEGAIPSVNPLDGTLVWPANGQPPVASPFSITGTRYAEYFCFGPFSNDRMKQGGLRLPRKMVMRRFDLFGR